MERRQLEVDFVADTGITDGYSKIIVVRDNIMPYRDANGFVVIGIFDFLPKEDSLDIL